MTIFYEKAILDEEIGPFFTNELGDDLTSEDWVEHIELLADFWLAKLLGEDTYIGNFIGAHIKLPHIRRESFARWIELFSVTSDEVYTPELSKLFKKKGVEFSKEFMSTRLKV
ncbi:MAG: group III truncated hemoglobin [Campylobacterota bacterium]